MLWAFFDWETLGQHAEFAKAYVLHSSQVKGWDVIVMGAGLMAIGTVPKR